MEDMKSFQDIADTEPVNWLKKKQFLRLFVIWMMMQQSFSCVTSDLTSTQVAQKLSVEKVGEDSGVSKDTVRRYIRLTNLIPEVMDMVDSKQIAFNPAVELSYLKPSEQKEFLEAMDATQAAPSLSQAQRMKKLSQEGTCTLVAMCEIMNEVKKGELDHVTIKNDVLRKYFPKSYTPKQMEDTIIRLLEQWQRKKQRDMNR